MEASRATWVIPVSLSLALVVHLLPVPFEWRIYRPPLVELTLLYWALALPHRVGIISAAAVGAGLDLVEGTPMGSQSLGLVFAVIMVLLNYQRIRQFDVLQQIATMMLLIALVLIVERWAHNLVGLPLSGWSSLFPVLVVPLVWPLLRAILRDLRRQWSVN